VNVEQRTQEADMANIPKINISGEEVGEIAVPEALAEYPCNAALVHACVIAHLAARRQGTACTKTKGEVKASGRKPYSQKGTGRARAGYISSPLRVGGGVVFGPKPHSYTKKIDRAARRQAFFGVLADRVRGGAVRVVESWEMAAPKTKALAGMQQVLGLRKVLCIGGTDSINACLSARNLPELTFMQVGSLGVYDLVCHRGLVISADAWSQLEERFKAAATTKAKRKAR
jgi:large subunit ribosomal protein L4